MKAQSIDVALRLTVDAVTLNRALCVIDWYLKDNPGKTIVIKEEDGDRICLIADREKERKNGGTD